MQICAHMVHIHMHVNVVCVCLGLGSLRANIEKRPMRAISGDAVEQWEGEGGREPLRAKLPMDCGNGKEEVLLGTAGS